jgi:hypothetical protein
MNIYLEVSLSSRHRLFGLTLCGGVFVQPHFCMLLTLRTCLGAIINIVGIMNNSPVYKFHLMHAVAMKSPEFEGAVVGPRNSAPIRAN